MYGDVIMRDDLTVAAYGYTTVSKPRGGRTTVVVECSRCHTVLRRELRNAMSRHQCPSLVGNIRHCNHCKTFKDLSQFHKNSGEVCGYAKLCKECYNKYKAASKYDVGRKRRIEESGSAGDYRPWLSRRVIGLMCNARLKDMFCNITPSYMLDMWESQNHRCYYTDHLMIPSMNNTIARWNSPSVDKKTPDLGYTVGNVVWCTFAVNSFKGSLTELEFKDMLTSTKWWECATGN